MFVSVNVVIIGVGELKMSLKNTIFSRLIIIILMSKDYFLLKIEILIQF